MKKHIILGIALFMSLQLAHAQHKLVKLWESKDQLPVPESVLYIPDRNELFVSLIDGKGNEKDSKGGIAILNMDGSLKNPTWIQGLHAPKGMAVSGNELFVADIDEVVVIDISQGKVTQRIPVEGATFLNDVTVDNGGIVYISDTRQHKIFKLENKIPSLWLDNTNNVNGLKMIDQQLHALVDTELWVIDKDQNINIIAKGFEEKGDGLEPVGNGDFLVTCWPGIIYYVTADGAFEKLLDVRGKMNTADLGYNEKQKILYIPTFNSNSVIAYQLQ